MPPDPRWQESSWRRGGEPARLSGIAATEILVFSAHWSQIKFAETEFGANRKMALTLKPAEGRTQQVPASRSLSPLHRECRGSNSWTHSQGLEIRDKRCRGPEFSLFALFGNSHQASVRQLGIWVWHLVPVVESIVLWGFPADFLPVIQKGESKPLRGGFQKECTIKLSINKRLKQSKERYQTTRGSL